MSKSTPPVQILPHQATDHCTVLDLELLCLQHVHPSEFDGKGFQPTGKQVFFFMLVWVNKRMRIDEANGVALTRTSQLLEWDCEAFMQRIETVIATLLDWGAIVDQLQQRNSQEFEMLRIQLERGLKYFVCPTEWKEDSLQEGLVKLLHVLEKLPRQDKIERAEDIVAFFNENQANLGGIYDFGVPFYTYAQRISRNALYDRLRHTEPMSWENLENQLSMIDSNRVDEEIDREIDRQAQQRQLHIDVARLLHLIETELTKKQRAVIRETLVRRRQFWLALELAAMVPPPGMKPELAHSSDEAIANTLGISTNAIAVHRYHAKKGIEETESQLGALLGVLLNSDF